MILPLGLDKTTTKILKNIIALTPDVQNMGQLFGQAIMQYMKTKVPKSILTKARELAQQEMK